MRNTRVTRAITQPMMGERGARDGLEHLISALDTIATDKLKRRGYEGYVDEILNVAKTSLKEDGTRLTIVIQYIKNYRVPCFQRDVLVDVLNKLITSPNFEQLLIVPFSDARRDCWDSLASAITAIPDLIANCQLQSKYPHLTQGLFYEQLACKLYTAIEHHSQKSTAPSNEIKLFLLKIIGRIAVAGHKKLIWQHMTFRAIQESRDQVRSFLFDLIRVTLSPDSNHIPFGIYMESLCLTIFCNLKPPRGQVIRSILGDTVTTNEQLRYLICDKSIFKFNYNLPREKQAMILFNIAGYLSSLVTRPLIDNNRCGNENNHTSLLVVTLLEIVRSWTSSTKILIRTYQHSKYITYALVVFLRHAVQHDKQSIIHHAAEIQTLIARSLPMYLNRASPEQRNLATCLSKLVLPILHELLVGERQIAKDGENEALKLNFNVDPNDDLLYLQQLFQQDVGVLFRDLTDTTFTSPPSAATEPACSGRNVDSFDANRPVADNDKIIGAERRANDEQLQAETKEPIEGGGAAARRLPKMSAVVELDDQLGENEAKVDTDDDARDTDHQDDLRPYRIDDELGQDNGGDDDEFALGEDAANVPIYLRDCINGLTENNSHLYVRLCLIRAGVLVNDLIEQEEEAVAQTRTTTTLNRSNFLAAHSGPPKQLAPDSTSKRCHEQSYDQHKVSVNDTIRDVGIELARALLFLDNQFNIDNFNAHRMGCLISLCYAAPDLVGRYLLGEFNGQSRSMQQQLDILHILVASAIQLSAGSRTKGGLEAPALEEAKCVAPLREKKINRFAPFASVFFYGIVYRLKADFMAAGALITSQPKSIMSAFRRQNDDQRLDSAATSRATDVIIERAISQGTREEPRSSSAKASRRVLESSQGRREDEGNDDDENFLDHNCLSDDSFLLSRILIAIANIIGCSAQQVATCKLSSDLLDILSAYRCHPDSGVQRAMVNCLRVIREATPSTYYKEYIERRMVHLFGPWLSENEAKI